MIKKTALVTGAGGGLGHATVEIPHPIHVLPVVHAPRASDLPGVEKAAEAHEGLALGILEGRAQQFAVSPAIQEAPHQEVLAAVAPPRAGEGQRIVPRGLVTASRADQSSVEGRPQSARFLRGRRPRRCSG